MGGGRGGREGSWTFVCGAPVTGGRHCALRARVCTHLGEECECGIHAVDTGMPAGAVRRAHTVREALCFSRHHDAEVVTQVSGLGHSVVVRLDGGPEVDVGVTKRHSLCPQNQPKVPPRVGLELGCCAQGRLVHHAGDPGERGHLCACSAS